MDQNRVKLKFSDNMKDWWHTTIVKENSLLILSKVYLNREK